MYINFFNNLYRFAVKTQIEPREGYFEENRLSSDYVCFELESTQSFYDYKAALRRIIPVKSRPRKSVLPLLPLIDQERQKIPVKQDEKYSSCLKVQTIGSDICLYSKYLLRQFCPEENQYTPVSVRGDGNCLFNAASFLLCGSDEMSAELRLRTLIELTNFKHFYTAQPTYQRFEDVADYDESVIDCATFGGYSSIWTLCGLINGPLNVKFSHFFMNKKKFSTSDFFLTSPEHRYIHQLDPTK